MTEEDIPVVSELDREIFPDMKMPTNFQKEMKNCLAHYFVALDGKLTIADACKSSIVGYAGLWIMVGEAHVVNIAVSNGYRRQGLGELLLIALVEFALSMCCNMMTLEVRASNTTAQKLYEKFGFTVRGVRTGYYTDNHEDGVIMTVDKINNRAFRDEFEKIKNDFRIKRGAVDIILTAPRS
jgi:ribosomal-protein-alanine N-acetyltransferase